MQLSEQRSLFDLGLDMEPAREVKMRIMNAVLAVNTVVSYAYGWKAFQRWCREAGRIALPASAPTCLDYASWCIAAGLRLETVHHRLKAINHYHRQANLELPFDAEGRKFLRNAKRALCERPQGMTPLSPAQLRQVSQVLFNRQTNVDTRDRAVILLGFACGWRRSELVGLDLRDLRWTSEGIEIWLAKSKTDQEAQGRPVGVQYGEHQLTCPLTALKDWLAIRGNWAGPLFSNVTPGQRITRKRMQGDTIRRALKRAIALIGEDPGPFGAHSLRSGMITAAIEAGASETSVMQRTGHKSYDMLRRYVRPATVFRSNPLRGVL